VHAQKLNDDGYTLKKLTDYRALALKALDQRLHAANINKSTSPAPAVAPMVASINTSAGEGIMNENDTKGEGA
jgi:hypothetical protein